MKPFNTLVLDKPKANLRVASFRKMTNGVYDVTAVVSGVSSRDDTASLFRETVGGRMAMISGSFREVETYRNTVRFTAKATATVKGYSDCASMTSIGNSQFTDTAGDIWSVLEDKGDRYLVLNSQDDLDDLLTEHRARGLPLTAACMSKEVDLRVNDFAAMVTDEGSIVYGFAAKQNDKAVLLDPVTRIVHNIDFACIVDAVEPTKKADWAALASSDLKVIFDYLSKIYPPEFIRAYKAQIGA